MSALPARWGAYFRLSCGAIYRVLCEWLSPTSARVFPVHQVHEERRCPLPSVLGPGREKVRALLGDARAEGSEVRALLQAVFQPADARGPLRAGARGKRGISAPDVHAAVLELLGACSTVVDSTTHFRKPIAAVCSAGGLPESVALSPLPSSASQS